MVDKPFPQGIVPTGANATSGITLGMRFRVAQSIPITGVFMHATGAMSGLTARVYEIGGNGGGDGTVKAMKSDLSAVVGQNFWPLDSPLTLIPGRLYAACVTIGSGVYGVINPGGQVAEAPFETLPSGYLGVFDADGTPPTTMTISTGESTDAPWNDTQNFYGVGVYYDADSLYDPITFTAARITETTNRLSWGPLSDAPHGVTIIRSPGAHTVDGDGDAFGETGYDPTDIPGTVEVARGVTSSPYVDTLPETGIYTYAVIRTGPGA